MRSNIFRLVDRTFGGKPLIMEVAAMTQLRSYGFRYIYAWPPEGVKVIGPLLDLYGGTIGYRYDDIDGKIVKLEQWTGKKWVKVHACRELRGGEE